MCGQVGSDNTNGRFLTDSPFFLAYSFFTQTLSMVVGRVILFRLEESPKYLLNNNRHQEAAVVLCRIFKINHKEAQSEAFDENIETLTLRFNRPVNAGDASSSDDSSSSASEASEADLSDIENSSHRSSGRRRTDTSSHGRIRRQNGTGGSRIQHHRPPGGVGNGNGGDHHSKTWIALQRYRRRWKHKIDKALERLEPLFVPEFRLSTILIWIIWALVAFAYTAFNVFYPKFLQEHGQGGHQPLQLVYMDILIYAAAGVPGSVVTTFLC